MSYQSSTPFLALDFFVSLQGFARELHGHAADEDKAFLQDVARGRYPMVALQRLIAIAARSPEPRHHEVLSEMVRPRVAAPSVVEASNVEALSTGPTDIAQWEFMRAPCRSTAQRLKDRLLHQIGASRHLYAALTSRQDWQ